MKKEELRRLLIEEKIKDWIISANGYWKWDDLDRFHIFTSFRFSASLLDELANGGHGFVVYAISYILASGAFQTIYLEDRLQKIQ